MSSRTSWLAIIPDILLMCVLIGFITIWKKLIIILTTKLNIDDKIVSAKTGLINIQTLDSPINKVTSVKVEQSIFGKIFNYGNIYINTASGQFIFKCLNKPNDIKNYLVEKIK